MTVLKAMELLVVLWRNKSYVITNDTHYTNDLAHTGKNQKYFNTKVSTYMHTCFKCPPISVTVIRV